MGYFALSDLLKSVIASEQYSLTTIGERVHEQEGTRISRKQGFLVSPVAVCCHTGSCSFAGHIWVCVLPVGQAAAG
jgi:hypothetical protein